MTLKGQTPGLGPLGKGVPHRVGEKEIITGVCEKLGGSQPTATALCGTAWAL